MAAVPPDRLSDVPITEQLHRRVPHNADYKREKLAIKDLAQQMVDHPEGLMPGLVSNLAPVGLTVLPVPVKSTLPKWLPN